MKKFRPLWPAIALLSLLSFIPFDRAAANTLVLNLSTTAAPATPLYGAAWDGSTILSNNFGVNFRDFQFNLAATSTYALNDLIAQINADAQNRVGGSVMGVTVWSGPIATNADFSNALGTFLVAATNWTGPGFQTIDWGPGGLVPQPTISSLPSEFFLRVWGTGASSPQGFKAKLGSSVQVAWATNTLPAGTTYSNYNGTNYSPGPTFEYTGPVPPVPEAVPEPGTWAMAALLLATGFYMRMRRRAQTA